MPVLHKYIDRNAFYVRTLIKNAIVTFQLTPEGEKRLGNAGIREGDQFRRRLLISLIIAGQAFTGGTGPGVLGIPAQGQLELDLKDDPEPETLFPKCGNCESMNDLHFVEIVDELTKSAALYCSGCRKRNIGRIDTSIPLQLIKRGTVEELLDIKKISKLDKSVSDLMGLIERAFKEKWDELVFQKIQAKKVKQKGLFDAADKQKKLI